MDGRNEMEERGKMKKKNNNASYIFIVIGLAVVILYLECVAGGGNMNGLSNLVDMPSLLALIVIGVSMLLAAGLGKDFMAAFRLALGKEQQTGLEARKRALEAVRLFMKTMRYGGGFFTLLPLIDIFMIGDKIAGGMANVAVALVVLLYAYAANLLLLPIQSRLEIGIIEYMNTEADEKEGEITGSGE